jgi:hypothetical protein
MTRVVHALFLKCDGISDKWLFLFTFAWVFVAGLFLQLVFLPYIVPSAHWGHGLIAEQDSVGFHRPSVALAAAIREQGWSAWRYEPGELPVAITSALYAAFLPEPWVALPLNGLLFAAAVVATRQLLGTFTTRSGTAVVALAPFFLFPSFVPIWGQLHRDLTAGTGLVLVLAALVIAARRSDPPASGLRSIGLAAAGMTMLGLSRPYALMLVLAATIVYLVLRVPSRSSRRGVLIVTAIAIVLAAAPVLGGRATPSEPTTNDGRPLMPPAPINADEAKQPDSSTRSAGLWPQLRLADESAPRYANCFPRPAGSIVDTFLFNLCIVREGFVIDSIRWNAGSLHDDEFRLRTAGDFIAYLPRAVRIALFEPGPAEWGREKRSTIGRLGHFIIPIEMTLAYAAFVIAIVSAGRRYLDSAMLAAAGFCVTYAVLYVFAIPQMGTFYRMRAFAFTLLVSLSLALAFERLRESSESRSSRAVAE